MLITMLEQKLSACSQCPYDLDSQSKQTCKNTPPPSYFLLDFLLHAFKEQHKTTTKCFVAERKLSEATLLLD